MHVIVLLSRPISAVCHNVSMETVSPPCFHYIAHNVHSYCRGGGGQHAHSVHSYCRGGPTACTVTAGGGIHAHSVHSYCRVGADSRFMPTACSRVYTCPQRAQLLQGGADSRYIHAHSVHSYCRVGLILGIYMPTACTVTAGWG